MKIGQIIKEDNERYGQAFETCTRVFYTTVVDFWELQNANKNFLEELLDFVCGNVFSYDETYNEGIMLLRHTANPPILHKLFHNIIRTWYTDWPKINELFLLNLKKEMPDLEKIDYTTRIKLMAKAFGEESGKAAVKVSFKRAVITNKIDSFRAKNKMSETEFLTFLFNDALFNDSIVPQDSRKNVLYWILSKISKNKPRF